MTPLYHITHVRNLAGIVSAKGIWCDRLRSANAPGAVSIAHQHIKERRAKRRVPIDPGGTLADYVPFYFAPRSPMLFTIDRGNVEGYSGGQKPVVHLETTVEAATALRRAWVFTDGHAEMLLSEFYDDLARLRDRVDWTVMRSQYWNDTAEDGDRKRRRQAEFLVREFSPWSAVVRIGVINREIGREVEATLLRAGHQPAIIVQRDWYY